MKYKKWSLSQKLTILQEALENGVIETVNDELKNVCQVEHSRHRSPINFFTNLIAGIIAYHFLPKKPAIRYEKVITNQLALL